MLGLFIMHSVDGIRSPFVPFFENQVMPNNPTDPWQPSLFEHVINEHKFCIESRLQE